MSDKLETLIESMQQATTLDQLQSQILGLRNFFDVEHLVYHSVNAAGGQYAALTYSDEWVNRYLEAGYDRIDPVVAGAYKRFHPVDWKTLDWGSRNVREFLGEAVDAGVGNQGFTVPLRGPSGQFAIFSVNHNANDDSWQKFTDEHTRDLILAAHFVNQKALDLEGGSDFLSPKALSPREKDALSMLAIGLNRANAADKLSISEHTLRVYIESARYKLGASNTTHAVARAISLGFVVV